MMRKLMLCLGLGCFLISTTLYATWQMGSPSIPGDTSNQYKMIVKKGTLGTNIMHFANDYGWKVVWQQETPKHYPVLINSRFSGRTFADTLNWLLNNYPLSAIYSEKQKQVSITITAHKQRFSMQDKKLSKTTMDAKERYKK